jgi:hypothetical protein
MQPFLLCAKFCENAKKFIFLWHTSLFRFLGKFSQNEKKKKDVFGTYFYSDFDLMAIFLEQLPHLVLYSLENFRIDMLLFTFKSVLGCSLLMQCQNYFIIKKILQPCPKKLLVATGKFLNLEIEIFLLPFGELLSQYFQS